jgi:polyhydroxyalkanoate synthase
VKGSIMPTEPLPAFIDALQRTHLAVVDGLRREQASVLDAFGLGPHETEFRVVCSGPHWRLREYSGADAGLSLLMVPAPIKRPYIWDLTPTVSAVRYCLHDGLRVYLVEWMPPSAGAAPAGLDEYADQAIARCVAEIVEKRRGARPFLMGHSLGGTLAAIFCALAPTAAGGLVLLEAPLCFEPASSRFRDALVSLVPASLVESDVVAGSLLSQVSAAASPDTFVWSRWIDGALSLSDPAAAEIHARIERWALDEVALPGKLVNEIFGLLYRENRFCRGTLSVGGKLVGPSSLQTPLLAVVNPRDEIGSKASVATFIGQMAIEDTRIIECPSEIGVGLQHLAMLAGRQAFARVWPDVISWLVAHQ